MLLKESVGASGIGTSSSDLTGLETWEREDIFRRGLGAGGLRSFFLCERLPVLVGFGVEVPEAERMAGVEGAGWEDVERAEESAVRASKSERWFANVF